MLASIVAARSRTTCTAGCGCRRRGSGHRAGRRAHLSVLLGVFVLLKAVAYWLDRYGLAFSRRAASVHRLRRTPTSTRVLPAQDDPRRHRGHLRACCSSPTSAARGWLLPAIGVGLLVLSAILIGGIYPAIVQRFQVRPNEQADEAPYIQRNIDATRQRLRPRRRRSTRPYHGRSDAGDRRSCATTATRSRHPAARPERRCSRRSSSCSRSAATTPSPTTLDVDRYTVTTARRRTTSSGVRELTHGLPPTSATGSTTTLHPRLRRRRRARRTPRTPTARPSFAEQRHPAGRARSSRVEPRIYFGEQSPTYSIVGADQTEIDQPRASSGRHGDQAATNTYDGKGGVDIGDALHRLLYAMKFREPQHPAVRSRRTASSQILYDRTPAASAWRRSRRGSTLDGDPYPAVVGRPDRLDRRRLHDDATTTRTPHADSTLGALTRRDQRAAARRRRTRINYIRNSVKATVDAYDGTVTLYEWDERTRSCKTWMKAFPRHGEAEGARSPSELHGPPALPGGPVQGAARAARAVPRHRRRSSSTAAGLLAGPGRPDATTGTSVAQPPYYLTLKMPGPGRSRRSR